jgi:hypothetical protein
MSKQLFRCVKYSYINVLEEAATFSTDAVKRNLITEVNKPQALTLCGP